MQACLAVPDLLLCRVYMYILYVHVQYVYILQPNSWGLQIQPSRYWMTTKTVTAMLSNMCFSISTTCPQETSGNDEFWKGFRDNSGFLHSSLKAIHLVEVSEPEAPNRKYMDPVVLQGPPLFKLRDYYSISYHSRSQHL